jgi:hypothetical protein
MFAGFSSYYLPILGELGALDGSSADFAVLLRQFADELKVC